MSRPTKSPASRLFSDMPSGLGGCLACVSWSWVTSPAFRSFSTGIVHKFVRSGSTASGHIPGSGILRAMPVLRDGKGLRGLAVLPLNAFSSALLK